MNASEVWLTFLRELRRNLRSAKGIALGGLLLLGGGAVALIYIKISKFAHDKLPPNLTESAKQQLREDLLKNIYSADIAHYLAGAPPILLALFKGVLVLIPLMTLLVGFEQVSGERQFNTLRYYAVRATRSSLVVGKALSIWAIVSMLTGVLGLLVAVAAIARSEATAIDAITWGGRFWLAWAVVIASYSGLTVLASTVARRPVISLFIGLVGFFSLWLGKTLCEAFRSLHSIAYAFPGTYDSWLVTSRPTEWGAVAILLAWGIGTTALASVMLARSDV